MKKNQLKQFSQPIIPFDFPPLLESQYQSWKKFSLEKLTGIIFKNFSSFRPYRKTLENRIFKLWPR